METGWDGMGGSSKGHAVLFSCRHFLTLPGTKDFDRASFAFRCHILLLTTGLWWSLTALNPLLLSGLQ